MRFVMPLFLVIALAVGAAVRPMLAEVKPLIPVTQQMLEQPSPDDWLMFSRTYGRPALQPPGPNHHPKRRSAGAGVGTRLRPGIQ